MIRLSKLGKVKVLACACLAIVSTSLVSCGGDDEGGSANGSDSAGIIKTSDGDKKLLTSVGDVSFEYDENNKLIGVSNGYEEYEISYSPFTITCASSSGYYSEKSVISNISVNGRGAITSLKEVDTYEDDDLTEVTTTTISFSYDGAGHLTSFSGSSTEVDTEDGVKETYKASGSYKFTWSNNKIVKITQETKESDGYRYVETTEFGYDEEFQNPCNQLSESSLAESVENVEWLAYLGYLGIGGDYLPFSSYREWEDIGDDSDESGSESLYYKYSFNSDGTLASESYSSRANSKYWSTTKYSYNYLDDTRSMPTSFAASKEKARGGFSRLFIHKKH